MFSLLCGLLWVSKSRRDLWTIATILTLPCVCHRGLSILVQGELHLWREKLDENPPRSLLVSLLWSWWVSDRSETGSLSQAVRSSPFLTSLNTRETDRNWERCFLTFLYYLRGVLFSGLISQSVMGLQWFLPDCSWRWVVGLADRATLSKILQI